MKLSCPEDEFRIPLQHNKGWNVQKHYLMLHKRRVNERHCKGEGTVRVCRPCYEAVRPQKPRLSAQMLANGFWLGRHPEIMRQMPYAHGLMLPSARVVAQRVPFGPAGMENLEKHSTRMAL